MKISCIPNLWVKNVSHSKGLKPLYLLLNGIIEKGAALGIQEVVIGMAHRGRLNVLANILKKTYEDIFNEFEGKEFDADALFGGDVKYHLGYSVECCYPRW